MHDINGPSSLFRRELCPGSGRMEEQVPDVSSPEAEHGTKLHEILAGCIRDRVAPSHDECEDAEDLRALRECYELAFYHIGLAQENGGTVLVEHKLDLEDIGISRGGTLDFAVLYPTGYYTLIDWKFGTSWVAAPFFNRQMHAYSCGLRKEFGAMRGEAIIAQPFAMSGETVRSAEFTEEELATIYSKLQFIVQRAKDPKAPLIPGDHCGFCRAKSVCPARRTLAESQYATSPWPVSGTIASMEPKDRGFYFDKMRLAKAFLEGAIEEVELALMEGRLVIPGYTVGPGRKTRVWVNEGEAASLLEEELGDKAYVRKVLSPAQAEAAMGEKSGKKLLPAKISKLIGSKPGNLRVVRDGSQGLVGE